MWKFDKNVKMFDGKCDKVEGLTGDLWSPIREGEKPDISIFVSDICRSVTLKYDSEVSKYGIDGYKWIADEKVFDNGVKYPDMACYCNSEFSDGNASCPNLKSGVFSASKCKYGAPVFISFPHFYLADESYISQVDGMRPNKENHEVHVSIEPKTGIPLEVHAQLQFNLHLRNHSASKFRDISNKMIPMFWFRQKAKPKEELVRQTKLAVILSEFGSYLAYAMVGISLIPFGVFAYCTWKN